MNSRRRRKNAPVINVAECHEEPISKKHDRGSSDCGESALDAFLQQRARKNPDRGASKTFLAISNSDSKTILGFYSLRPASLEYAITLDILKEGLARYDAPVFRLARLAVNLACQGQGVGGQLILAAGRRCMPAATEVCGVVILIDAKSTRAAKWYATYGDIPLKDAALTLVLPLSTIATALKVDR